jgi:polyhydroxyalkanoate synthesis regulator phasin
MNERESRTGGLGGIGEGLRTGVGVLNAFREAIEETVSEALESGGDVTPDRAKAMMREAAQRVQSSFEETRERLDFVSRREFDELRREIADLRAQIAALHGDESMTSPTTSSETPTSDDDHEGIIIVSD